MAKAALEYGLVDDLMHPEQAQSLIAEIVGRDEEKGGYRSIGYEAYLQALGPRSPGERNVGADRAARHHSGWETTKMPPPRTISSN